MHLPEILATTHHCINSPLCTTGQARGRAAEAVVVTLRQLDRRCGPLSDATTAQIKMLPLEQLEALADALLDFSGPADLAAWLAEHSG